MFQQGDHWLWSMREDDALRSSRTRRRGVGAGGLALLQNRELRYQVIRDARCKLACHPKETTMR